jgi:hypothetical protein
MALAMAGRDIDRSGNNQLNRLLAYRKERSIAPEFQEAQIERLAGDNYREKEFQRKQEEAMDWQNNFLYNTALFAKSMLDEPSRFEREDIEDLQQRLQDEGVALGGSFWNQGGSRSSSRPPGSRGASREASIGAGGGSAAPGVRNAFSQTDPAMASMSTAMENPSLGQTFNIEQLNVYNMLPPVEGAPVKVKEGKGGRKARGGTLDTLSGEGRVNPVLQEQFQMEAEKLQKLYKEGKIDDQQLKYLLEQQAAAIIPPKTKSKGGKARPYKAGDSSEGSILLYESGIGGLPGAGKLGGLDESAVEFQLRTGYEFKRMGGGEAAQSSSGSSIDPQVIVDAQDLSFDEKVDRLLTLFDYPLEIESQGGGMELIPDDLRLEFGAFLMRFPNLPKRGETAWKRFMKDRSQKFTSASGGSIQTGAGGLRF